MRKVTLVICTVVLAAGIARGAYSKAAQTTDAAKAEQLVKKLKVTEVLGPLAPVALSPFFGITCLSATSMLSEKGVLPRNEFLAGNRALNNWMVFAVFLILTIVTSIPKMTSVSKAFAEAADRLEAYAGIITYLVIFYLAASPQNATDQVAYSAGIISFTKETILAVAIVANIIVINTVKYFFELLVLISPIPVLDAAFEAANKAITAILAAVYAFNPYLALILNILLFLVCLSIYNWSKRRVKHLKAMYLDPVIAKVLGWTMTDTPVYAKARMSRALAEARPILRVFPTSRVGKIKKKESCYLTAGQDGLYLVALRLFRKPRVARLDTADSQIEVVLGLLTNAIEINVETLKRPCTLGFSRVYNGKIDSICDSLHPSAQCA